MARSAGRRRSGAGPGKGTQRGEWAGGRAADAGEALTEETRVLPGARSWGQDSVWEGLTTGWCVAGERLGTRQRSQTASDGPTGRTSEPAFPHKQLHI